MASPLFIGRFQPLHKGHLSAIKDILKIEGNILIGIGSTEESYLPDNPFTCSERIQMIEAALQEEKVSPVKYRIIPVRNINNYGLWVKHVQNTVPPFDKVYCSSKIVKRLFEDSGVTVKPTKIKYKLNATQVRKAILSGKSWEKMVPKSVSRVMREIDGVKRLKDL